jgi:tetratricopeptide (TPR) repeat protein
MIPVDSTCTSTSSTLPDNKLVHFDPHGAAVLDALEWSRQGHQEHSFGNHVQALTLLTKSLETIERLLPDSPEVAVLLSSIGSIRYKAGIDNGFQYHWRALQIRVRDQPNTAFEAESQEHLGLALLSEHRYEAALKHFSKALSFHEYEDPDSFVTAIQLVHVGKTYESMKQLQEARASFERAMRIVSRLQPDSLDVASCHVFLGRTLFALGNIEEAKEQLDFAVAMYENVPASLDSANAYVELARVYGSVKGYSGRSMTFFAKALHIQHDLAPKSLDIANTLHHMAVAQASAGDIASSQIHLEDAISIQEKLAPYSPDLARSLFTLGEILGETEQFERAHTYHLRALNLRSLIQPLSLDEADSLHAVGNLLERMGNWEEALSYYSREFVGRNLDTIETARVHNKIGNLLLRGTNRFGDAIYNHRMAVTIQARCDKDLTLVKYLEDLITALLVKGESPTDAERQLEQVRQSIANQNCR